jgi:hypothetical protein
MLRSDCSRPGGTWSGFAREVDFRPATSIEDGIRQFVAWYRVYHGL